MLKMFEPWMLAAIDEAGYNGIRDEHLDRVADEILKTGLSEIDRDTFNHACRRAGVNSNLFDKESLARLQDKLR